MIGERIRMLRKQNNITMKELGKMLTLGESTISMYENGKRMPDYNTLSKIADYFKVSTDWLLNKTDNPTPPNKKAPPKPEPDIKWGDFGISFYEGGKKKLTQAQKDKIAKLVQIAVMDEEEYWKNEKGTK